MTPTILVLSSAMLMVLLIAEKRESLIGKLFSKPLLSALFILTALQQPRPEADFAAWMLAGLGLSWIGDVLLIFTSRLLFLCGLVAFLAGHICYAVGFYSLGVWGIWVTVGLLGLLAAAAGVYQWLRPHLGNMRVPVAAYIIVISAMVAGALAVASAPSVAAAGRWCVPAGAIAFYLSDICVARDQFVTRAFVNRLLGLPLYYLGQFLLAVSIGLV